MRAIKARCENGSELDQCALPNIAFVETGSRSAFVHHACVVIPHHCAGSESIRPTVDVHGGLIRTNIGPCPRGTARSRRTGSGALTVGYVTNGATFTITGHTPGGGLVVRAEHGTPVTLPADYVAKHVQLGYAVTAHRAQGSTLDTTHVAAAPGMTREAFYVAMTRGRHTNHAHVIADPQLDTDRAATEEAAGAQALLERILANTGQQRSAHDTRTRLEHQAQQWISRREIDSAILHATVHVEPSSRDTRQRGPRHASPFRPLFGRAPGARMPEPRGIDR